MTPPIRVLFCIESMLRGGTEKQLASLIRGFDPARVTPSLCTLKPSAFDLDSLGCPILELGFTSFRAASTVRCLRRLRRFIREQRVDLVETFFQDPTILALLGSVGTQVRARVASFRDLGFWRTRAKILQLRLAYPHFDGFIANSRAVAARAHTLHGIALERIEVIYNGVVVPPPRPDRSPQQPPVVGVVANLDRSVKRVDLFLSAASLVRREVPDARFVVLGDGPLRPQLMSLAGRLELGSSVSFPGNVPDVARHLASFDVGVLCSDSEGFSNSILEYMAAGVATVARDVGGNAELVVDGETGRLIAGGRPDAIATAIIGLLHDPAERCRMGERARELARARYSLETCVQRHEKYYERMLAGLSGPPIPR